MGEPFPDEEKARQKFAKEHANKLDKKMDIYTREREDSHGFVSKTKAKRIHNSKKQFAKQADKAAKDLTRRKMNGGDIYKYLVGRKNLAPQKVATDDFDLNDDLFDDDKKH